MDVVQWLEHFPSAHKAVGSIGFNPQLCESVKAKKKKFHFNIQLKREHNDFGEVLTTPPSFSETQNVTFLGESLTTEISIFQ